MSAGTGAREFETDGFEAVAFLSPVLWIIPGTGVVAGLTRGETYLFAVNPLLPDTLP